MAYFDTNQSFKVQVEFEDAPIRKIKVQCPKCKNWFTGWDVTNKNLLYESDIYAASFTCPICNRLMTGCPKIENYDNNIKCMTSKTIWELEE